MVLPVTLTAGLHVGGNSSMHPPGVDVKPPEMICRLLRGLCREPGLVLMGMDSHLVGEP